MNVNGFISFNKIVTNAYPTMFPDIRQNIVSVFWNNIDIRNGGNVYVRLSNSSDELNKASKEIRSAYADMSLFTATWMLIVTWDNVTYYSMGNKVHMYMHNYFNNTIKIKEKHSATNV